MQCEALASLNREPKGSHYEIKMLGKAFRYFDGAKTLFFSAGKKAPLSINPERSRRVD